MLRPVTTYIPPLRSRVLGAVAGLLPTRRSFCVHLEILHMVLPLGRTAQPLLWWLSG